MLAHPTLDLLNALGLYGLAKGFKELEHKAEARGLEHAEWLGLLLEYELTLRRQKRFETRSRAARLRHPASVEDVDYQSTRGLDRALFLKLAACDWIAERRNLLITGASGLGKSWLACALGQKACRQDISVLYYRVPRLFTDLAVAHGDGSYGRLLRKIARARLLILDDWGPEALVGDQARDLLEIVEDRYDAGSLVITSQVPVDRWHEMIGIPTIADAILDRVIHNAYRLEALRRQPPQAPLGARKPRTGLTASTTRNIIQIDLRTHDAGGRHQIGTLAGFGSEQVAGFILECMAGFVGIRTLDHVERSIGDLKAPVAKGTDDVIATIESWRKSAGAPPAVLAPPANGTSLLEGIETATKPIQEMMDLVTGNSATAWVTQRLESVLDEIVRIRRPQPIRGGVRGRREIHRRRAERRGVRAAADVEEHLGRSGPAVRWQDSRPRGILSPEILRSALIAVSADALEGMLRGIRDLVLRLLDLARDMLKAIRDLLLVKIRLPFIEDLVKLVTGGARLGRHLLQSRRRHAAARSNSGDAHP